MSMNPNLESVESFVWWRGAIGFSSKLIYSRLVGIELVRSHLEEDNINAFKLLWTANVPNNIQVFAWRLLMNMLQTRYKLVKRGVLTRQHNLMCPLCLGPEEAHLKLFLLCPIAAIIWQSIQGWLELSTLFQCDSLEGNLLRSRK